MAAGQSDLASTARDRVEATAHELRDPGRMLGTEVTKANNVTVRDGPILARGSRRGRSCIWMHHTDQRASVACGKPKPLRLVADRGRRPTDLLRDAGRVKVGRPEQHQLPYLLAGPGVRATRPAHGPCVRCLQAESGNTCEHPCWIDAKTEGDGRQPVTGSKQCDQRRVAGRGAGWIAGTRDTAGFDLRPVTGRPLPCVRDLQHVPVPFMVPAPPGLADQDSVRQEVSSTKSYI